VEKRHRAAGAAYHATRYGVILWGFNPRQYLMLQIAGGEQGGLRQGERDTAAVAGAVQALHGAVCAAAVFKRPNHHAIPAAASRDAAFETFKRQTGAYRFRLIGAFKRATLHHPALGARFLFRFGFGALLRLRRLASDRRGLLLLLACRLLLQFLLALLLQLLLTLLLL